jgi:hypothetical protein
MDFEYVLTGDESWFYSYDPPDTARAASRDELPERIKRKIDTENCLISVLWSDNRIHYLIDVTPGMKYHSLFSSDVDMSGLIQNITSTNRRKTLNLLFIHLRNARPHNSK